MSVRKLITADPARRVKSPKIPKRLPRVAPDIDEALAQGWAEGFLRDYADDIPVWEHKVFRATPALAEVDGPFARYRRWYAQFYA